MAGPMLMPEEWPTADPSRLTPPTAGDVHVYRITLEQSTAIRKQLASALNDEEHKRAHRFVRPLHRHYFTVARGTLRYLLARLSDQEPHALKFEYGEYGKPSLVNAPHELQFNLSHSQSNAVIAVTHRAAIGIDIESYKSTRELEKLARRYFSPTEVSTLFALPTDLQEAAFYRCWSSKEALMKGTGLGLSLGLDSFDVEVDPRKPPALLKPSDKLNPDTLYRWAEFSAAPKVSGILVLEGALNKVDCADLNPESLLP